jgi:hypothetical protein
MTQRDARREHWQGVVAEQGVSGEGVRAFCERKGIRASQFYAWRRRVREEGGGGGFVELVPAGGGARTSGVAIEVGGVRIEVARGFDVGTLRAALAAVVDRGRCWR